MELSEKLKAARLEAGLSQRQLCGEEITRNMLSLIENGAAKPSVKTLRYLAARLGKPLSYFLDDRGEEDTALADSFEKLSRAEQAVQEGKFIYAAQLLEQVTFPAFRREKLLLTGRIPGASPRELCTQLPSLDGELLLRAAGALDGGALDRCAGLLGAVEDREAPRFCLLYGRLCFAGGDFSQAAGYLTRAEAQYPREVIPLLEACYKNLGDYRLAYEYACKQKG